MDHDPQTSDVVRDALPTPDLQTTPETKSEPSSLKRLEANRRNAQLSTGPRTEAGKFRSRCNALTHGILTSKALIVSGAGAENKKAFQKLLQDLYRELGPVGQMEELFVQEIAISMWRLRRLLEAEVAIIQLQYAPNVPDVGLNPSRASISGHLKLPEAKDLDRLVRYETAIQRRLSSALAQLERLQEARNGQPVPPRLNVRIIGSE